MQLCTPSGLARTQQETLGPATSDLPVLDPKISSPQNESATVSGSWALSHYFFGRFLLFASSSEAPPRESTRSSSELTVTGVQECDPYSKGEHFLSKCRLITA